MRASVALRRREKLFWPLLSACSPLDKLEALDAMMDAESLDARSQNARGGDWNNRENSNVNGFSSAESFSSPLAGDLEYSQYPNDTVAIESAAYADPLLFVACRAI